MEIKNNIDELYLLITNSTDKHQTFIDNLDIWTNFYNNRITIISKNILNPKLFAIIEFLLGQEKGEIFDCFHSNLIEELDNAQKQLSFNLRNQHPKSKEDIDKLLNNLQYHDDLVKFLSELQIEDTFGDVKKYKNKELELETIDALIISLYNQFFSLEPDIVRKLVDYITKELISLQNTEVKSYRMNTDLIYQYLTKILPIKKFIGQDLKDDELFKQIRRHQIKDKSLLRKMFKELSLDTLLEIFEDDLNNVLTFFEGCKFFLGVFQ